MLLDIFISVYVCVSASLSLSAMLMFISPHYLANIWTINTQMQFQGHVVCLKECTHVLLFSVSYCLEQDVYPYPSGLLRWHWENLAQVTLKLPRRIWKNIVITMTSHERHVVSNHRSIDCLFNRLCGPTSKKHQNPHYRLFVNGIHWWPVNSPHIGPVTRKELPFDDVIIKGIHKSGWYNHKKTK